jgi:twitching motility two-component system response regulator PilG
MTRKLLVVDDSRTIRASIRAFTRDMAFVVAEAENGYVAIKAVMDEKPDIIFADVMMPRLDGYKFCSVIKNNPEFARTPVIMLTSKDGMIDQARAQLVKADGYIVKPFSRERLSAVLIEHLGGPPPASV